MSPVGSWNWILIIWRVCVIGHCFSFNSMTNEANVFYKPLRRVSFCECTEQKKGTKKESNEMHAISMMCEEPVKLSKSPKLKVCIFLSSLKLSALLLNTHIRCDYFLSNILYALLLLNDFFSRNGYQPA